MDARTSTPQAVATVIAVEGQAFARNPAGELRPLHADDVLLEGDTIVTMPGGQVQLAMNNGEMLNVLPNESFKFAADTSPATRPDVAEGALRAGEAERVIQALQSGQNIDDVLDPTEAGLNGGGNDSGNSFVRLLRIVEGVTGVGFEFGREGRVPPPIVEEGVGPIAQHVAASPETIPTTTTSLITSVASVSSVTVTEGTAAVFTVSLSSASSTATSFSLALANGTATLGSDFTNSLTFSNGVTYNSGTGTLSVPAGVTSFTATVPTVDDTIYESSENFTLTVGGVAGTGTIADNDSAPTITHVGDAAGTVNSVTVTEGTSAVFTVNLSNASSTATSFALSLADGSAVLGSDYTSSLTFSNGVTYNSGTGTISVPAGVTSFTVTVPTTNDTIYEPTENFTLKVGTVTGTGNITDNDSVPTITHVGDAAGTVNSVTVTEGTSAVFTVNLSNASSTATSFSLALANGTATLGSDFTNSLTFSNGVTYNSGTGTLSVPAGVTSFTVTVPTINDTVYESTENFTLKVGSVTGTGNIADNDSVPTITHVGDAAGTVNSVTVSEGTAAVFTVNLSNASSTPTSFSLALADGSAVLGSDYTSSLTFSNGVTYNSGTGTLSVPAGVTSFTVTVPTINDTTYEPTENFTLKVGTVTGTGNITDNDSVPTITHVGDAAGTVNSVTVTEGASAVFTVNLSNASSTSTSFALSLADGSAVLGSDYTNSLTFSNGVTYNSGTGQITVPAGVTSFTVTVPTINDTIYESTENFTLTVGSVTGTGSITDNDSVPTITHVGDAAGTVNSVTVTEGISAVFTVNLSNASSTATSFSLGLADGSAVLGSDYTSSLSFSNGVTYNSGTGTVSVPAGVTSFTVTVPTINDTIYESSENFTLTVGSVTGTGNITDNDSVPTITHVGDAAGAVNSVTVAEGAAAVFTVKLSNASSSATSFNLSLADGTAVLGSDYTNSLTFSNGVTYNSGTGTVSVPAGVTSFTITVPTINDTIYEPTENFTLTVGSVTGTGNITDNDSVPTITHVGDSGGTINSVTVAEGTAAVFTVNLSNASSTSTSFALSLADGSAVLGSDYTSSLTFSNGVTYNSGTGTVSVPAGVTSFTVTVPTINDTIYESTENFTLTVGSVTGTGNITDNDSVPTINHVGDAAGTVNSVTVAEGTSAIFTVNLSNASSTATSFALSLADGSAVLGSDYTNTLTFSNGVTYNSGTGQISVPAGVTSFTVTVPTIDDTTYEATENFTLTVGSVAGTGNITDNDSVPTITHVGDAAGTVNSVTVTEGAAAVFTVTLSNASSTATSFSLALADGTAALGSDYTGSLTFSNGVTYNSGTGTISVPAGVTSFTVAVPTINDTIYESTENFTLTVGAVTGTGNITDNDSVPTITHVGDSGGTVNSVTVTEGTSAVFTVNLSNASSTSTSFALSLADGSAVLGSDYTSSLTFSNGVTYNSGTGQITVPAGVTSFTVTVPTINDTTYEPTENFTLTVGSVTGTGNITDNDSVPTITHVGDSGGTVNSVTVTEGASAVFTVNLSNASSTATSFALSLADGSAVLGSDYTNSLTFSNGVTYNSGTGAISVPAGVTSFTVTIPTINDTIYEPTENFTLTVGSVAGTGNITDNDSVPTITHVGDSGGTVNSVTVVEGASAVFTVTLSNASSTATSFALSLADGTATLGADYTNSLTFSNGVTYNSGTGQITVPAGVTSFTVTVPTIDDTTYEPSENFTLTVGTVAGTGNITDNDGVPTITHVGDSGGTVNSVTVTEGTSAVFTVNLSNASSTATSFALSLADGSAILGSDYTNSLTFSNGVTYNSGTGQISVPAGVTSFTVTVPTIDDTTYEPSENFTLTVGSVTGTGNITDNDSVPTITHVGDSGGTINSVTVTEGTSAVFTVNLSNASSTATSFALTLADGSAVLGSDYTNSLTFSNGVTYNSGTGQITVPAGVTSFTVTVPTINDTIYEPTENFTLTVGSIAGTGNITDNDGVPAITHVGDAAGTVNSVTVVEGTAAVFTVNLSNASSTATSFALNLADGSAVLGSDYTNGLTFSNGVTYNSGTGQISVPAGVTAFTVTIPTVDDTIAEATENFTLTVGSVTGTGNITDNDGAPTITHVGDNGGTVNSITVTEGTSAAFTVNLSNASSSATSFSLSLADGTATLGSDYTNTLTFSNGVTYNSGTGQITVPAGVTSFTVTVPTINDTIYEPTENFSLTVGSVTGTGNITDNDPVPTITHVGDSGGTLNSVTVTEGTSAVFTVNLSNASSTATSFALNLADGSAVLGSDYTNSLTFSNGVTYNSGTGQISVPAGVTSFTVTVPTIDDSTYEPTENFTLTVGSVTGTGNITDNDSVPTITHVGDAAGTVNSVTVTEGASAVFTVNLSNASSTATSFSLSLADGTAIVGSDYTNSLSFSNGVTYNSGTGTISVPAGVTSFTVTIPTINDTIYEPTENFSLTVGAVTGTGNITDNDSVPTITHVGDAAGTVNSVTVAEGAAAVFTVNLSNASSTATNFSLALADGTAVLGSDYTNSLTFSNGVTYNSGTGMISVPAGVTSFTVTVPTTDDTIYEPTENFSLTVGSVTGTGNITDNDPAPTITHVGDATGTVNSVTVAEGTSATFTVNLSNASSTATSFSLSLADGSAVLGSDYTNSLTFSNGVTYNSGTGTISVPVGVTSFTVTVPTINDTIYEPTENFTLTVGAVSGTGNITDNDSVPTITHVGDSGGTVNSVTVAEGTAAVFTVNLSNASSTATSFVLSLADGTAVLGSDYTNSLTFSNGVTYNSGTGIVSVPAGVTSFTVTVPTIDDTTYEPSENFTLTVGSVTGTGNITDNDSVPTITHVGDSGGTVNSVTVTEGTSAVFTVNLSNASSTATSFALNLADGSAVLGSDYTNSLSFSNGVTYNSGTGTISVPAGVTSFTVTVPTINDTIYEPTENFTLTVGSVTGTGTITDNDSVPTITHVGDAAGTVNSVTVTEGTSAVFTVNLSNASSTSTSFALSLADGSAVLGSDYTNSLTFSNGVTYNSVTGQVTVPAGVTAFTVTAPTIDDTTYEPTENFTLTVGSVTGTGNITDNDSVPTVTHVGDAAGTVNSVTVTEGTAAVFTVNLSNASSTATSFALSLADGSAVLGSDYTSALTFSNGVTYNSGTGQISVPAGVTSFTVTIPTVDDTIAESSENFTLTVGSVSGTGNITDNDGVPTITHVGDAAGTVNSVTVTEGTAAVFTVNLSNASSTATSFSLGSADGTAVLGSDYTNSLTFSNGVTYNSGTGTISVPAGVTSFTVTVPTINDTIYESTENFTLTVGSVTGTGSITDNDSVPTITHVGDSGGTVNSVTVTEGTSAVFTVNLSNASSTATSFSLSQADGTAVLGSDYTSSLTFSNGVTYNSGTGTISVPAGVTSFTVTVPTINDTIYESTENFTLTVGSVTGTGSITDNDSVPTITHVGDSGGTVNSVTVTEGTSAVFTVNLSNASSTATSFSLSLADGTAVLGSDYTSSLTFSNGVTYNSGTGQITVPAGVTSFTVSVPTINDTIYEPTENFTLTVGSVTGTGNITDNDSVPTITHVGDSGGTINSVTVTEGTSAIFTVNLSNASSTATSFALNLADGSAVLGSDYTNSLTFSNGVTYNSGTGQITVPAGVTSFTVTIPTLDDTIAEATENFTLTVGAVTGTGNITDNDSVPTITHVGDAAGTVNSVTITEGTSAVFTVNLSNASSTATSFSLALADGTAILGSDYTNSLTFSNGVTYNSGTGQITVPAGVTSFTVTVPTIDDTTYEPSENFTLTVGTVAGTGNITDNDSVPTITHVGDTGGTVNSVTVTEGTSAVFTVNLSNASSTSTSFALSLADGSAVLGSDYTNSLTFSNGVTYNSGTGQITVPAGVTSFTVTVPTINDTIYESTENFTLTVGSVTGTGNITDNDSVPTVTHVGDVAGTVNSVTVVEGASAVFTVNLSNASSTTTSFSLGLADGTAALGSDYTNSLTFSNGVTYNSGTGTVSVPAGVTSFTVTVPTINDTIYEPTENFSLTVGTVTSTGNITDNDSVPTVTRVGDPAGAVNNVTVIEGTAAVFTVNLSNASSTATSFNLSLADNTAVLGSDYTNSLTFSNGVTYNSVTGTVSVPAGVTSFTVTVPTINDTIYEPTENFRLTVGSITGTGSITDNDSVPTITHVGDAAGTVNSVTVAEGVSAVFTVNLSNGSSTATSFNLSLADGTAILGSDYTNSLTFSNGVTYNSGTGTISVPAGVTSFTVTVPTINDTIYEPTENFTLTVGSVAGTGSITDNDPAPGVSAVTGNSAAEGSVNTFTVTLSNGSSTSTNVSLSLNSGTATVGIDTGTTFEVSYDGGASWTTLAGNTATVPATTTSFLVRVAALADTVYESAETYTLTASVNSVGATGTATILNTDNAPTAVNDSATAGEAGGVNNATAGTNPSGNVLSNDTDPDSGDTKAVTAVSFGATSGVLGSALAGNYGTLTLNADGSYSYIVDNNNAAVQALRTSGNTLSEVFNYTMSDAAGMTSSASLTVTIQGANDAPIAVADVASLNEDATVTGTALTGVLSNDTDVDTGDTKIVSAVAFGATNGTVGSPLAGTYGTLTLNADGSYSYTANTATAQALAQGQVATEAFTYTVRDTAGATSTTTLTFTITGTNDAPIANADTATAMEAGGVNNATAGLNPSGNVLTNDTDVDTGDTKAVSAVAFGVTTGTVGSALSGAYGTLTLNADGSYSYVVDNNNGAVQALRTSSDTLTEVFNYTIRDAAGATSTSTLTVTIQGSNDAPIAVADVAAVNEDATVTRTALTGVLSNDTDVDTGDTKTVSAVSFGATSGTVGNALTGSYGVLTLNADGSYSYTANTAAAQTLAQGQTATEVFNYTVRDTAGATSSATLTFTITGTNDAPAANADTATAVEAGGINNANAGVNPSGNVLSNDTDVDAGDTKAVSAVAFGATTGTVGTALSGNYGTLTLNADGSYSYVVDNSNSTVQALRTGSDTLTEVFSYTMRDAAGATSTSTLTVTIHGSNDAPVAVADVATAVEAGGVNNATAGVNPSGNVLTNDTDVDAGDTKTVSAVAFGATSGTVGSALAGNYGTITQNADGSYSYVVDNNNAAVQALRTSGNTLSEVFTYTVRDTAGATSTATVTVTIQGSNDTPVAVADVAAVNEDATVTRTALTGVLANDTDVDSGDTKTVSAVAFGATNGTVGSALTGTYGTLTLNADGSYSYVANTATAQTLAQGQTATETFTYTVRDTAGATSSSTLTFTITGTNDAPVAVADTAAVNEDATVTATALTGVLSNDTDVDVGDTKTVTAISFGATNGTVGSALTGTYGTLTLNADGSYSYTANTASAQALAQGQVATETFNYTMRDAAGATSSTTLTFTITGTNDAPVANAVSNTGNEDTLIPITLTGTDVDGTVASFTLASLPANGRLYLDAAMTQLAPTGTALTASGNSLTLYFKPLTDWNGTTSFSFSATDNNGAASGTATATINVTPVNDGTPLAVADTFNAVLGSPIIITKAQLLGNDYLPDRADLYTIGTPSSGTLVDNGNGTYTYTPAATGTATFSYTIRDDQGETSSTNVSINVFNSRDDLATVQESALSTGTGGGTTTATGNLLTNDVSNTSVTSVTFNGVTYTASGGIITIPDSVAGAHGTLVVNAATGAYTYTLTKPATNGAPGSAADASVTDLYSYQGNSVGATLRVTIQDDKPTAVNQIVEVPEASLPKYTIAVVLDISGSMDASVSADGVTSRLDMAKAALGALVSEYFNHSSDVIVKFVDFSTSAALVGTYTTQDSAVAALTAPTPVAGGSTNYQAALDLVRSSSVLGTTADATRQNVVYFLSDGVPTAGTTSTGIANYQAYLAANPSVKSYAVGIGTGIVDFTNLNAINNVDALGDGVKDPALVVPDLNQLNSTLLATVPNSFGGSLMGTAGMQGVNFGADGGYINTVTIKLDSADADTIPDTNVTFTYNPTTNQITQNSGFLSGYPISGSILKLDASQGFTYGTLVIDFKTGEYTYFTQGLATQGTQFDLNFTAIDRDGDTAAATQTVSVVDGKPVAHSDTDTLFANGTFLEGNVVTGLGTDGGVGIEAVTPFTVQGSGVDTIVDNAKVTAIDFHGTHFVLGTWSGGVYTAANTSGSGTGYSYTVSNGTLTWNATSGGQQLVFNDSGYYKYTPPTADVPTPVLGTPVSVALTSTTNVNNAGLTITADNWVATTVSLTSATNAAAGNHLTVSGLTASGTAAGVPVYSTSGVGVSTTGETTTNQARINGTETLVLDFSPTTHPNGVSDISLLINASASNLSNTATGSPYLVYTMYDAAGNLLGSMTNGLENTVTMLPYSGVASVHVTGSSTAIAAVQSVSFYDTTTPSTVSFNANGVNVTGGTSTSTYLDNLETMTINFNHATYAYGVQNVSINVSAANSNLASSTADAYALTYTIYNTDGQMLGQFSSVTEGTVTIPSSYSNIGSISIEASNSYAGVTIGDITGISFTPVLADTTATPVAPELVNYTLTDNNGDTSSAGLTLNVMANSMVGTSGNDTLTGTGANDFIDGQDGNDVINAGAGNDIVQGGNGSDTITAGSGDDFVDGGAGNDTVYGNDGNDTLRGNVGNDILDGGNGNDLLVGGVGNDQLTGGLGADVFRWELADGGTKGSPAVDTVTDFDVTPATSGGDVLDLRDLLVGENHTTGTGNLADFLHFEKSGADTVVHVSTTGGFGNGYIASAEDQTIILQNADLVGTYSTDQQVIQDLLNKSKLITD